MRTLFFVSPLLSALPCLLCAAPAKLSVVGDWQIRIEAGPITVGERQATLVAPATLDVAPSTVREELYGKLLADFQACGSEWIILTPHYVRPDWMGFTSERDCDDDPRPYVQALRGFASENPVALADGSRRCGRLWRMGIPYNTLMMNAINHPNPFGMKLFADAIMALFPEP